MVKNKKKKGRKKLPSIKSLWDRAWFLQSRFIRQQAADFQGYAPCYTCYKVYPWQELQAGHFIHQSYDFSVFDNIRPQCSYCNGPHGHGKPLEYYLHLVQEIGQEAADHARNRKHSNAYKRQDLLDIIAKYTY